MKAIKVSKLVGALILFTVCCQVSASTPVVAEVNEIALEGNLPAPYNKFSLKISLDSSNENVIAFYLVRGTELISLTDNNLKQLKSIKLHTIEVSHEMNSAQLDSPAVSSKLIDDLLYISADFGDIYRAERKVNDKGFFKWGRDKIKLTITKNNNVTISTIKLGEMAGQWKTKTW